MHEVKPKRFLMVIEKMVSSGTVLKFLQFRNGNKKNTPKQGFEEK